MQLQEIIEILKKKNISVSENQATTLLSYMEGILEWNEKVNLTAIKDEEEFVVKHYADSLAVLELDELGEAEEIIDVGTGGGFPGVPLAIMCPEKKFVLLDSLEKRLKIIEGLAGELGINNIETLHSRAEDAGRDPEYRERFDLCVSRAVADLSVLSEYCLPFVKPKGSFVAYKSKEISEEISGAEKAISILGGRIERIEKTSTDQSLVVITKTKNTPTKYPRKAGDPKRKPL